MNALADSPVYSRYCVHCGLCLSHCPTYVELGNENDSPRGRIYLLEALSQKRIGLTHRVQGHLDLCLDCRACETACPSGVEYGRLIETFRHACISTTQARKSLTQRIRDWGIFSVLTSVKRTRWLLRGVRLADAVGLVDFIRQSGWARNFGSVLRFPEFLSGCHAADASPAWVHPAGHRRGTVGLFLGCVGESMFSRTNRATLRVLVKNGWSVYCPPAQVCCGAIDHHGGRQDHAVALAKSNIEAFGGVDCVVVNVAGCGMMLKQYAELFADDPVYRDRAVQFTKKIKDVHEFLSDTGWCPPEMPIAQKIAYHPACHLRHGQQIVDPPRRILESIDGVSLVDFQEADFCCGAAGTYCLTQPDMARRLAMRKLRHIQDSGAETVAIANAGCILHLSLTALQEQIPIQFVHPIDLLDRAYRYDAPCREHHAVTTCEF